MLKHLCSLHVGVDELGVDELHQRDASDWDLRELEREGERREVAWRGKPGRLCVLRIED